MSDCSEFGKLTSDHLCRLSSCVLDVDVEVNELDRLVGTVAREAVRQPRIGEDQGAGLRLEADGIAGRSDLSHVGLRQIGLHLARPRVVENRLRAVLRRLKEVEADKLRAIAVDVLLHLRVLVMFLRPHLREEGVCVLHVAALIAQDLPRALANEFTKAAQARILREVASHLGRVYLVQVVSLLRQILV